MKTKTRGWKAFGQFVALSMSFSLIAAVGCSKKKSSSDDKSAKESKEQKESKKETAKKTTESAKAREVAKQPVRKVSSSPAVVGKPGDVQFSVGMNVTALKKTFLWALLVKNPKVKEAMNQEGYKLFTKACKVDPMKDLSSVVIGMGGKGKDKKMAIIATGTFDSAQLLNCAKVALPKAKRPVKDVEVSGKKGVMFKTKKGEEVYILVISKNTMVMASKPLGKQAATGSPSFGNDALADMLKGLDKKALLWGGMGKISLPAGGGKMQALLGRMGSLRGGNFTVNAASGNWKLDVTVDAGKADSAKKLVQLLNFAKMGLAMKAAKGGTGGPPKAVVETIKKLNASTDGSKLKLNLTMPEATLKNMANEAMTKMK